METAQLLRFLAHGNTAEFEQALAAGDDSDYALLLRGLVAETDDKLVFWCLELLLQKYQARLSADTDDVIPLLLSRLSWKSGPVFDRASRLLNELGKPALVALLAAIEAAPDEQTLVARIAALRDNPHLYLLAEQTISLLSQQLDHPAEDVQYWALIVLMDISPLRPGFDSRLPIKAFDALYSKLLDVASRLKSWRQDGFAERYEQLLTQHLYRP